MGSFLVMIVELLVYVLVVAGVAAVIAGLAAAWQPRRLRLGHRRAGRRPPGAAGEPGPRAGDPDTGAGR